VRGRHDHADTSGRAGRKNSHPYPNDSAEYRRARTALLAEEIELRRHIERVAEQRRALPPGGAAPDYDFIDENGKTIKLADLFGQHTTLVTYFWMYGPQRERPCPMCTAFLGALDIPSHDLTQRIAVAVIGRSPVARQLAFARRRGWRNLQFYQCVGDAFRATTVAWRRTAANGPRLTSGPARVAKSTTSGPANSAAHKIPPGPARRPRPDTTVEHPRPDTRRPRQRLVSEAIVLAHAKTIKREAFASLF
jgi:hypothetical protein